MVFGGLMEKECSRPALLDKLDRFLDRDQDRALFGLPPRSLAGADRTPPAASASLKSLSKEIVGREMNSTAPTPPICRSNSGFPEYPTHCPHPYRSASREGKTAR